MTFAGKNPGIAAMVPAADARQEFLEAVPEWSPSITS
jgi:hypothetical protein